MPSLLDGMDDGQLEDWVDENRLHNEMEFEGYGYDSQDTR